MVKVAMSSYHTFYVDTDNVDEAVDRAIALLHYVVDNGEDETVRLADCETTVDYTSLNI